MANVRNVNDFVEQLSNCVGEISGDEVVFKKIQYSSEYVVRMRNHNEKVANIWYDYDKDKIIVQLVPAFRNMEYSLDDLTIDTIKGIGQMVRKNALNRIGECMEVEEAKKILNENGYFLTESDDIDEYWSYGGDAINHQQKVDVEIAKEFLSELDVEKVETYADVEDIDSDTANWNVYMEIYIPKSKIEGLSKEEIADKYEIPLLQKLNIEYDDGEYKETDEYVVMKEIGKYKYRL